MTACKPNIMRANTIDPRAVHTERDYSNYCFKSHSQWGSHRKQYAGVTFRAIWWTIETLTANKNSLWILTFTALKNETLILCNMMLQMRHKKCNFTWDTFLNGISRCLWSLFCLYWLTIIRLIDLNHQKNTSKSMNETHFQEMTTLLTLLDSPRSCQA